MYLRRATPGEIILEQYHIGRILDTPYLRKIGLEWASSIRKTIDLPEETTRDVNLGNEYSLHIGHQPSPGKYLPNKIGKPQISGPHKQITLLPAELYLETEFEWWYHHEWPLLRFELGAR